MAKKKLGGLGKGLNAIFIENDSEDKDSSVTLPISEIEPNRSQPRKEFDEKALAELADSGLFSKIENEYITAAADVMPKAEA